ncbi:MAG: hypothetical protein ACI3VS_01125 [Evtepia sp.]
MPMAVSSYDLIRIVYGGEGREVNGTGKTENFSQMGTKVILSLAIFSDCDIIHPFRGFSSLQGGSLRTRNFGEENDI